MILINVVAILVNMGAILTWVILQWGHLTRYTLKLMGTDDHHNRHKVMKMLHMDCWSRWAKNYCVKKIQWV